MTDHYLSRIRLRSDLSVQALAPLLFPAGVGEQIAASHHWIWSLFADGPDRRRDFLWREDLSASRARGSIYYALSARPPLDAHGLFRVDHRVFDPALEVGDRLRFSLRASPSISKKEDGMKRGKRHDPIALALSKLPAGEQAGQRQTLIEKIGRQWLERQGEHAGFSLTSDLTVRDGWRVLPRPGLRPIQFGIIDFEGILQIQEPALFLENVVMGFGKARAFGCGLMMIRRDP